LKKKDIFGCFKNKQDFVLFLKKTEKPNYELFSFQHAISLFSELGPHNDNNTVATRDEHWTGLGLDPVYCKCF